MQKCIRRNQPETAVYWAYELYWSGYGEWCWKRLRIISSEDVGLAEPGISAEIWALNQMYREAEKKKEDGAAPGRLFLVHAVLRLCQARKSRMVDWTLIVEAETHEQTRIAVADVALDKHTARGRQMKRGFGHFFEEGSQLQPHEPASGENEMREKARRILEKKRLNGLFHGDD